MSNQRRQLNPHQGRQDGKVLIEGRRLWDFSSNDYLGLADRNFKDSSYLSLLSEYPLGSTGSRLLSGNPDIFHALESKIAKLTQKPAALLYNSGYQCNVGVISALADKQTLFLVDKYCHASIIDGLTLSKASFQRFRHQDLSHLETLIKKHQKSFFKIIVVVESLYSMDGDQAPLQALIQLKQTYKLALYVDEAHAFGCFGAKGAGLVDKEGLTDQIDYLIGTFGKALGTSGAFIACESHVKDHLINHSRAFIYSTSLSPFLVACSHQNLNLIGSLSDARDNLATLSALFRDTLSQHQIPFLGEAHIVSIVVKDADKAVALSEYLKEKGFLALPIRPPTVPPGTSRVRFSLNTQLTQGCITELGELLKAYFHG